MNEISCEICRDLMPLVQDGVASPDSVLAVQEHIRGCEACKLLYGTGKQYPAVREHAIRKLLHRMRTTLAMLLMFGILYGVSLTPASGIFYNAVLMPLIGAVGYYLFRRKALVILPVLLTATHGITNLLGMGNERLDLYSLLLWSGMYSAFAVLGVIIAALLHFVFRKED